MTSTKAFRLGLIGHPVSHSKSPDIFAKFFEQHFQANAQIDRDTQKDHVGVAYYQLFDLPDLTQFRSWLDSEFKNTLPLLGFNVTVPHKTAIIPYLDELSPSAEYLQAVNTVVIQQNPDTQKPYLIGYNTDVIGFEKSLNELLNLPKKATAPFEFPTASDHPNYNTPKLAIILGNGGSAKAIRYVLNQHHIPNQTWHRGQLFNDLELQLSQALSFNSPISDHVLIIQTTPVGMWPNTEDCVEFPFEQLNETHWVIDLIYNPETTTFMKHCTQQGSTVMNGKYMLEKQAEAAWEIFRQNL